MYSNNDYRYYLEHRLAESDDFLAHYGVKGMKWKKRVRNAIDRNLANRAVKLGYERGGTYYANSNGSSKDEYVTVKKNNKDLASNYLSNRGYQANAKIRKRIKKIKNKRIRKIASAAANKTYKAYDKHVVRKAEKRAYDSHNIVVRNGRLYVKRGKKVK